MSKKNSKDKVTFPEIFEDSFYLWFEDYIKSLNLPLSYTSHYIGVGPIKTMYLCWITKYGSSYMFNCRKSLVKKLSDNREKILFHEVNKDDIIKLISNLLYGNDYSLLSGDIPKNDEINQTDEYDDILENDEINQTDEYDDIPENDEINQIDENLEDNNYIDENNTSLEDINSLIENNSSGFYDGYNPELKVITSLLESLKVNILDSPNVIFNYPNFISNRLKNCLCRNGYLNFNDLSNAKALDLIKMKNFGRKCLEELISILTNFAPKKVTVIKKPLEEIEDLEFELKITPFILRDEIFSKNLIKDIDENEIENYQAIANDYMHCINQCFENNLTFREIEILKRYYFSDCNVTLQLIGDEFGITRERVRQILKKSFRKLLSKFNRSLNFKIKGRAIYLFNQIEVEDFINFIKYGFLLNMNAISTKFYLLFIYSEEVVNKILKICEDSIKGKVVKINKYDDFIKLNAVFPSNLNNKIPIENIVSVEKLQYSYLINAMKKFMNISKITKVIPNPNIYYYENGSNKHNPDFALEYEDKVVLVIVLNTINLGFYYNMLRFEALHEFCKANGFGYIIMSERFKSYFDIIKTEIEPELEEWLLNILDRRNVISWRDILTLKGKFVISNEKIVAFVSKHNLKFTLNPFIIKKMIKVKQ